MVVGRRRFIGCMGALPLVGGMAAFAEEKPLLRMGVLTDTHVGETKASCRRRQLSHTPRSPFHDMPYTP